MNARRRCGVSDCNQCEDQCNGIVRYALTENPVVAATPALTEAELRRRARLPDREKAQASLFEAPGPPRGPGDGRGIWEER